MKITIESNDLAGVKQVMEIMYCSFCGKHSSFVKKLIAGPASLFICNECIDLCAEILIEEGVNNTEDTTGQI